MFTAYRAICRTSVAAALLCSALPAVAADVEPAPTRGPDDSNFFTRLYQGYADEWGMASAPIYPNAPPSPLNRRPPPFPPQPENSPPYPFRKWPIGGLSPIGSSVPSAVDSLLM